jgi:hypothetical protein
MAYRLGKQVYQTNNWRLMLQHVLTAAPGSTSESSESRPGSSIEASDRHLTRTCLQVRPRV